MRSLAAGILMVLCLGLGAVPGMAQGNGLRLMPVVLVHTDMPALRGLIPLGWHSQGGLNWNAPCISYGYNIDWQARSPDGGHYGVAFLPALAWGVGRPNCHQGPVASLGDLLEQQAQTLWPGARMIDYRPRPDLNGGQPVPVELPELGYSAPGIMVRNWADAGEGLFAFTAPDGQDMRGAILVSAFFSHTRTDLAAGMAVYNLPEVPGFSVPMPPPQDFLAGGSEWGFATWAPAGQLDLASSETIRKSFIPLAEWSDFIMQHRAVIDGQNRAGANERHGIRMETLTAIGGMITSGYNERTALAERSHREYIESIRGVETYINAAGQAVQFDHSYQNAWQLADGSYFLTNDPGFNPNAAFNMGGQQLQIAP